MWMKMLLVLQREGFRGWAVAAFGGLLAVGVAGAQPAGAADPTAGGEIVKLQMAPAGPQVAHQLLLDITRAGRRVVAVGEGGAVALSDDDGQTFRRARQVPVQATLTAVHFSDDRNGWAVGHWGVVLHTSDAGETWTLQVADLVNDRPLYSVFFSDAQNGVAVGLWSRMLRTTDGGVHWHDVKLPAREDGGRADRNLFHVFADARGHLFVTAEAGMVLRSSDAGATWQYLSTGYTGSLWVGLALKDGGLLVGGLRGTLMRSDDDGQSWTKLPVSISRSITGLAQDGTGRVYASGVDGLWLQGADGRRFDGEMITGRPTLTGVLPRVGLKPLLISKQGTLTAP